MGYHAKLSPSSADRWTSCTASPDAQEGLPNEGSAAARQGTACHQISEEVLGSNTDPQDYLGRVMLFWTHAESDSNGEDWREAFGDNPDRDGVEFVHEVIVTQDMIDAVVTATSYVQEQVLLCGGTLECEQRVPIGHFTGEDGATGSCDVTILTEDTIYVKDFKYGRHPVDAYEIVAPSSVDVLTGETTPPKRRINLQMACYALGALELHGPFYDFKRVHVEIVQPFIGHLSEYECSIDELLAVRDWLAERAEATRSNPQYVPSQDNCHFCRRAGPTCEAQTQAVLATTLSNFDNLDEATPAPIKAHFLGDLYAKIGMVESWCKAVGVRVLETLRDGQPVLRSDGNSYKLVPGKAGARSWKDAGQAETTLKSMRLRDDQMYDYSLISPTSAEKLAKVKKAKKGQTPVPPVLGSRQWTKLQELITQRKPEENPVIVLATDERAPLDVNGVGAFEDLDAQEADDPFSL